MGTTSDKPVTIIKMAYSTWKLRRRNWNYDKKSYKWLMYIISQLRLSGYKRKELLPAKAELTSRYKVQDLPSYKLVSTTTTMLWTYTVNWQQSGWILIIIILKPKEDGEKSKEKLGYEYVKTVVDDDGNRTHIFKKHLEVTTTTSQSSNPSSSKKNY